MTSDVQDEFAGRFGWDLDQIETWYSDQVGSGPQHGPLPKSPGPRPKFFSEDFDDICARDGEWLIKYLLPRVGLVFLAGPSMAGKSFLALELASAIARGAPVLGARTYRSSVLYVAAEAADGFRKRIEALRSESGPWGHRMRLIAQAPNLADEENFHALALRVREEAERFSQQGDRLGMVVVDTMSASIPGADENSAKDMSPILCRLQDLAAQLGVCLLVVAHVGKTEDRGIRGWSGMLANADGFLRLDGPNEDGTRVVKVVKVKDGEGGFQAAFGLRKVVLRTDADGDEVSSCVLEWRELPEKPSTARGRRMDEDRERLLTALGRLLDEGIGEPVVAPGAPLGTLGIRRRRLRDLAFSLGFHGTPPDDQDKRHLWIDARRKAFDNKLGRLQREGLVRQENDLVWPLAMKDARNE